MLKDTVVGVKSNDNAVTGVNLKSGREIACPANGAVVNCAGMALAINADLKGPYASELMAMVGLKYPVTHRKRPIFVIDAGAELPNHLVINTSGTSCILFGSPFKVFTGETKANISSRELSLLMIPLVILTTSPSITLFLKKLSGPTWLIVFLSLNR